MTNPHLESELILGVVRRYLIGRHHTIEASNTKTTGRPEADPTRHPWPSPSVSGMVQGPKTVLGFPRPFHAY